MEIQDIVANEFKSITSLVAPYESRIFFDRFWGEKPVHVSRAESDYFSSLFTVKHLDHVIGWSMTRDHIFFIKDGIAESTSATKKPTLAEIYAGFSEGWPLLIRSAHLQWPSLGVLNSELSAEFGFNTTTDISVTPPHAGALKRVVAENDRFFLQIAGETSWELQLEGKEPQPFKVIAGDTLYVPKGTSMQQMVRGDRLAACIEVNIFTKTQRDLLVMAIRFLAEKEIPLRKGLPFGSPLDSDRNKKLGEYLREVLAPKLKNLDWEAAKNALAFKLNEKKTPLPDGHFLQMREVDEIHLDTQVERRPGVTGSMRFIENSVELQFPGHHQHGPSKMFLAIDFVIENRQFKVGEIPGWYSDNEKMLWVRHLVRKGFLRMVDTKIGENA